MKIRRKRQVADISRGKLSVYLAVIVFEGIAFASSVAFFASAMIHRPTNLGRTASLVPSLLYKFHRSEVLILAAVAVVLLVVLEFLRRHLAQQWQTQLGSHV